MTSDGTRAAKIEPPYDETALKAKYVVLESLPYLIDVAINRNLHQRQEQRKLHKKKKTKCAVIPSPVPAMLKSMELFKF